MPSNMPLNPSTTYSARAWNELITNLDSQKVSSKRINRGIQLNTIILNWAINECHINTLRQLSKDLGIKDLDNFIDWDEELEEQEELKFEQEFLEELEADIDGSDKFPTDEFNNLNDKDEDFFKEDLEKGAKDDLNRTVDQLAAPQLDNVTIMNLKTIRIRHTIKMTILQGDIAKAFELINMNFPNLFDKNHFIYFKLLHLNLIEMIRGHVELKSTRAITESEERDFLEKVMAFVRVKLSTLKILSNKNFVKDLELTMVLLCYTDELAKFYSCKNKSKIKLKIPFKLRRLFDKMQRFKIAKLINNSILIDINNNDDINLIKYEDASVNQILHKPNKLSEKEGSEEKKESFGEAERTRKKKKNDNGSGYEYDDDYDYDEADDDIDSDEFLNDEDLILKFSQLESNKLESLIKLWIWSENKLASKDVHVPGINLEL